MALTKGVGSVELWKQLKATSTIFIYMNWLILLNQCGPLRPILTLECFWHSVSINPLWPVNWASNIVHAIVVDWFRNFTPWTSMLSLRKWFGMCIVIDCLVQNPISTVLEFGYGPSPCWQRSGCDHDEHPHWSWYYLSINLGFIWEPHFYCPASRWRRLTSGKMSNCWTNTCWILGIKLSIFGFAHLSTLHRLELPL